MTVEARIGHLPGVQEKPRPPIPQNKLQELPIETLSGLTSELGRDLKRKIYSMDKFREAEKKQTNTGETTRNLKFETDFKGVHYSYHVTFETRSSLLGKDMSRFTVERSWNDLVLGPNPEDMVIITETVDLVDSKETPELAYTWKQSGHVERSYTHRNSNEAVGSIRSFTSLIE